MRVKEAFIDILCTIGMRMKLIFKDKSTVLVMIFAIVLFSLLLRTMTGSAETLSALPIGIIDEDGSSASRDLIQALEDNETIRIVKGEQKELQKLLLDEMITSIFVIRENYETKLKRGYVSNLITMVYKEGNKAASILSDVVAGAMIYPISLYKSFHYYEQLPAEGQPVLDLAEYQAFLQEYEDSSESFNFAFDISLRNPSGTEVQLSNAVLYQQLIIGILSLLMSFIAMFFMSHSIREKEQGIEVRLRISQFTSLKRDIGNVGTLLFWEALLTLIFIGQMRYHLTFATPSLWVDAYLLLLLQALVSGLGLLLLTKVIKRMMIYQMVAAVAILISGGLSFFQLLSGFYFGLLNQLAKSIPNSWFLKGFTDIMINNNGDSTSSVEIHMLLVTAITLFILIVIIDLFYDKLRVIKIKRTGR